MAVLPIAQATCLPQEAARSITPRLRSRALSFALAVTMSLARMPFVPTTPAVHTPLPRIATTMLTVVTSAVAGTHTSISTTVCGCRLLLAP